MANRRLTMVPRHGPGAGVPNLVTFPNPHMRAASTWRAICTNPDAYYYAVMLKELRPGDWYKERELHPHHLA